MINNFDHFIFPCGKFKNNFMKILQLVTSRQYRGAEVFAANLSSELIKLGHEVTFAGLYKNFEDVLEVKEAGNVDLVLEKNGIFSTTIVKKLIELVRLNDPDVIQCNGSDTLKYMIAASYFLPKKPILYRNISMISKWMGGPKKLFYSMFFRRISHVSSVGNEAIEDFINTVHFPRSRTSVIRRGIPFLKFDEKRARKKLYKELNIDLSNQVVMHIGNFSSEKNHQFLIDIFSKIKDVHPHIKLVCVGTGNLFNSIKTEIETRNLRDTIFLLGFRKNIPELLAAADCFVLPSKVEGVPGVILEAAIQKRPTIATNVGGVKEVLKNQETGFCIDDFDKKKFENKLLQLLYDDSLREAMGEKAYKLAMRDFNPFKNAKKFENLYSKLVLKNKLRQGVLSKFL